MRREKTTQNRLFSLILCLALIISLLPATLPVLAEETVKTKADIVFVIDTTGSMGDEINNVVENLNKFTSVLESGDINYRIAVIDYKDSSYPEETSVLLTNESGDYWFKSAGEVSEILGKMVADGGGDGPETVVDAMGLMLSGAISFREDASTFAMLLTDADYKEYNEYGYESIDALIDDLIKVGVCTSVIAPTTYKETYNSLYTKTDGIFCDIYGNFAEELAKLAEYMKSVVKPVEIKLTTAEEKSSYYKLSAEIKSTDSKQSVNNLVITLTLPEALATFDEKVVKVSSLKPGETIEKSWTVKVPNIKENATYTWKVNAESDDFAVGVVCVAQDTFSVAGSAVKYNWIWGKDNYSFINSWPPFSSTYKVSDKDLKAFVAALSESDLMWVSSYGACDPSVGKAKESKVRMHNFLKNNLEDWGGSCYGMSLSAALFKIGAMDPKDFGDNTVYKLPFSNVESMINIYHMSQMTDVSSQSVREPVGTGRFKKVIDKMYSMGLDSLNEAKSQQPYLVRLYGETISMHAAHSVVCYGAEKGTWKYKKNTYHKRLLIADPNETNEEYIYISDDSKSAVYTGNSIYTYFGYRYPSLSELNNYAYEDMTKNYSARLKAGKETKMAISSGTGYGVIIANHLVKTDGDFSIIEDNTDDLVASEEGMEPVSTFFKIDTEADQYTVSPVDNDGNAISGSGLIDVAINRDDYTTTVYGNASSVVAEKAGTVSVEDAEGEITIGIAKNDNIFDFVYITGEANGDIEIHTEGNYMYVNGELSDYTISNIDKDADASEVQIHGDGDSKATISKEELVAYVDTNESGTYTTKVDSDNPGHIYTYKDSGNGTHTATCYLGDDEFNEAHEFVDGVCVKCGAEEKSSVDPSDNPNNGGSNPSGGNGSSNGNNSSGDNKDTNDKSGDKEEPSRDDTVILKPFSDVPYGKWYTEAVYFCRDKGYMAGKANNKFDPNGQVTRATITQVLYAMEGKPTVKKVAGFKDVKSGVWYTDSVNWAASIGIVAGYSKDKFGPNDPITRQQMAAIMYQYAKYKGYDIKAEGNINQFKDASSVTKYAIIPMKWAVGHGIISGTDRGLEPKGTATRAQIAVILKAFDDNIKDS